MRLPVHRRNDEMNKNRHMLIWFNQCVLQVFLALLTVTLDIMWKNRNIRSRHWYESSFKTRTGKIFSTELKTYFVLWTQTERSWYTQCFLACFKRYIIALHCKPRSKRLLIMQRRQQVFPSDSYQVVCCQTCWLSYRVFRLGRQQVFCQPDPIIRTSFSFWSFWYEMDQVGRWDVQRCQLCNMFDVQCLAANDPVCASWKLKAR